MSEKNKNTDKPCYNDFESLSKTIESLISETEKYKVTVKEISDTSKKITVINHFGKSLKFELNFIRYNPKDDSANLVLQFDENKINITYANKTYYVKYKNQSEKISSKTLEYILDDEFKALDKSKKENCFPYKITVQYTNKKPYPFLTDFKCPACNDGRLIIENEKTLQVEEYKSFNEMIRRDSEGEWDYDWFHNSFAGFLCCNNCSEKIAVLGNFEYQISGGYEEQEPLEVEEYSIKYFERVADFIDIESLQSEELKSVLRASFLLYFSDETACANKIRSFLDLYLTELGVAETKSSGCFKTLDERIDGCDKLDEQQKEVLKVLKDVGNKGSHGNGEISKYDLYRVYKCIESFIKQNEFSKNVQSLRTKFSR